MLNHKTPAAEALLLSLLDYAGLFPPAELDMAAAIRRYVRAQNGPEYKILGTFVVAHARLEELRSALEEVRRERLDDPVPVSLIVPAEEASQVRPARERLAGLGLIGALEVPPSPSAAVRSFSQEVPDDIQVFHEVRTELAGPDRMDLSDASKRALDAVAVSGACAKIRTGGLEAAAFPSILELAAFVDGCRERGVPFKATAGLHHAVRGAHRTRGNTGPLVWMHGFLNLAVGAAFLWAGKVDRTELAELLSESNIAVFELGRRNLRWRDRALEADEILRCRRSFFQSFGSCSFREPTAELAVAGWLEDVRRTEVAV